MVRFRQTLAALAVVISMLSLAGTGSAVAAANTGASSANAAGESPGLAHYPSCRQNEFCFYDWLDGGGLWNYATSCLPGAGNAYDLAYFGLKDKVASIDNKSAYRVVLENWTGSLWDPIWVSWPGNWGNLPPPAMDIADQIRVIC